MIIELLVMFKCLNVKMFKCYKIFKMFNNYKYYDI